MDLFDTFRAFPWFYIGTAIVFGLMVGSFLNVVIHRLPKMMESEWREQCTEFLYPDQVGEVEKSATQDTQIVGQRLTPKPKYNLVVPRSSCPACGHKITAMENIPILSYAFLRGKCSGCGTAISIRYPLVEVLTGTLTGFMAWHFGVTWLALFAIVFVWALIALTFIDADTTLLPDDITLPLMWMGLVINIGSAIVPLSEAVVGCVAGYLILWLVFWGFKLMTGKDGMGYGDFKLLAAIGAWLGWQMLPLVILLSAAVGTVIGIVGIIVQGRDKGAKLPFGPYLAVAGFIALIWGQPLTAWYLGRGIV